MSQYKVGIGHNVALVDLVTLVPQARNAEVKALRTDGDGGAQERALHCAFVWDVLGSEAEYQALLAQFGLLDTLYSKVTIYTRDEVFSWKRYNGVAVLPRIGEDGGWNQFFPRDFVIYIHGLVEVEG